MGALLHPFQPPTAPMTEPEATDADLVRATLDGDARGFETLVERHQSRLFGLVGHYTRNQAEVEDIVQEAFLKAYSKLDSFQLQASFSTWLHRIAVNTALDLLKRRGRNPVTAVEDPEVVAGDGGHLPGPGASLEREEVAEITRRTLEELPEIFRTVLVLREFEERSYLEIAEILDVSIGTVESRLFRARARFKEALRRLFPEYGDGQEDVG
ncbi:MAG: sigma-70 family RNA polymerase sigma factor [Planctomycetota bacterium]